MALAASCAPKPASWPDTWLDLLRRASYKSVQEVQAVCARAAKRVKGWFMSKLTKILVIVGVVAVAGGAIFLMTWDIPAPSEKVTKTLSNDRFPS